MSVPKAFKLRVETNCAIAMRRDDLQLSAEWRGLPTTMYDHDDVAKVASNKVALDLALGVGLDFSIALVWLWPLFIPSRVAATPVPVFTLTPLVANLRAAKKNEK